MAELTPKQARFVQEYLVDLNGTQAAIRAGYSEKTANEQASRLLANVNVSSALAEAQKDLAARVGITQEMVLNELRKIGFQDIRKVARWGRNPLDTTSENADPNGLGIYPIDLVPSEEIDDDTAAAVAEIVLTQTGLKLKMHDKLGALDKIARHLGMYVDKVELSGRLNVPAKTEYTDTEEAARVYTDTMKG